ncbi:MAG: 3-deoxy-D-manno-octulosonate 8-phosphate phosphatase [Thaumarchaeota archaeon]|jgi:YrbI family 3-deoxy-D-manno-octulosonate 8-phosphate phosphatase|nr:MAG: 3-deoxy-D-manno-octulosonate 8-phosphate phosphatase [Nitrososphaerota archaeon]
MINEFIYDRCKKIKLIATDVDGVLTDGSIYYSEKGETIKKFHVRDGMGVNILLRNDIKTIIITKENSKIMKKWAKNMNIAKVYSNAVKKEALIEQITKEFSIKSSEIAYIGDDVNDVNIAKKVGLSATPKDGVKMMQQNVHYICKLNGGMGAFRELTDLILSNKFNKKTKWY